MHIFPLFFFLISYLRGGCINPSPAFSAGYSSGWERPEVHQGLSDRHWRRAGCYHHPRRVLLSHGEALPHRYVEHPQQWNECRGIQGWPRLGLERGPRSWVAEVPHRMERVTIPPHNITKSVKSCLVCADEAAFCEKMTKCQQFVKFPLKEYEIHATIW